MTSLRTTRAAWPLLALVLTTAAIVVVALSTGAATPSRSVASAAGPPDTDVPESDVADADVVARGEELYLTGCVSCHGVGGGGTNLGPPLLEAGEAAADFYLRTGRMPLAQPAPQPPDKPRAYDNGEIEALVAYVGSIGTGPGIPDVDPDRGDLQEGAELFLSNCAACHNSSGIGGALSHGNFAPSLQHTDTRQIGEAMRVGPGEMPLFGPDVLTDGEVDSIVRYVRYLHAPEDPGGFDLGYTGPVPEGFVAFLFGLGSLIVLARWITREKEAPGG